MSWYQKKDSAEAKYVAEQCGITKILASIGNTLHEDDLELVRVQVLKVSKTTINQLFTEVESANRVAYHMPICKSPGGASNDHPDCDC